MEEAVVAEEAVVVEGPGSRSTEEEPGAVEEVEVAAEEEVAVVLHNKAARLEPRLSLAS